MDNKPKQILVPSIITAILLIIAVFPIKEYGFYILLRWVVTGSAIYIGYYALQAKRQTWVWLMGVTAILFNPIQPIHFSKGIWQVIDFVVAVIFIVSMLATKHERESK